MSADTIKATPSQLRQKAEDIERNAEIVKKEITDIISLVGTLRPTFLGETAGSFFKKFDSSVKNMEQWDDIVRSFAVEIKDAAQALEKADKQGAH